MPYSQGSRATVSPVSRVESPEFPKARHSSWKRIPVAKSNEEVRRSSVEDLQSELSTKPGRTSAGYGSLARIKHRADRPGAFPNGETRPCSQLDLGRRCPAASFRSPRRSVRRLRLRLCKDNRSCSRRLIGGRESGLRSLRSTPDGHWPRGGNSRQSTD
jgi:hypothetical protein